LTNFKNYIKSQVQNTLNSHNDSGTSTISTAISSGSVSVKVFKSAQYASPYVVNTIKNTYNSSKAAIPYFVRTAKGTYNIGVKTVKVVRTIDSTLANIKFGVIPLNAQTAKQFSKMVSNKLMYAQPYKRYGVILSNGSLRAVAVTRGVLKGAMTVQVAKAALKNFHYATFKGIRLTGRTIGYAVKKGAIKGLQTGLWSIRRGGKGVLSGVVGVGNLLSSSDDMGTQTLGVGIKSTQLTGRIIKTAPTVITRVKSLVVAPIKTGRALYHGGKGAIGLAKMVRKFGLKDTVRYLRNKSLVAFANAGRSAVTLVMNGIKSLGMKFAVPLLIIVFAIVAATNSANAPLGAVSSMFSGYFSIFSDDKSSSTDMEIHPYLQNAVLPLRQKVIDDVMNIKSTNLVSSGQYHYVRLFINHKPDYIEVTEANVNNGMPPNPELVQMIEPLFRTIMIADYNLEPTQSQVTSTLNDIWNTIIKIKTRELPVEYCNPVHSDCGAHLANIATCPNYTSGRHGSYTCSSCCYIQEHSVTLSYSDENGNSYSWTSYWTTDECNGYYHCNGHKILAVDLNTDGYYSLLATYFTDPIDQLANLATRTPEQEERLQTLKDNYELCLEYMKQVQADFGSESGGTDLSGVVFVNGTRPSNNTIIDLAKQQVGNIGGQPFWSWYGYNGRVEWCACFVSWCENQLGYINSGTVPKFSYCPEGVNWFRSKSQWADGGYQQPSAGDIIFYDWKGDGVADHVGLVIGNDGNQVYTVEGNSGDTCRIRSYSIGSSVILGYGLPNY
jgi:hypothetical protein